MHEQAQLKSLITKSKETVQHCNQLRSGSTKEAWRWQLWWAAMSLLMLLPAVFSGVVTAVVFISVCALAAVSRLLYQQRQTQRGGSIKEENRQSVYTDCRTELHLNNSVRDNMKEYYIWWQCVLCGPQDTNLPLSYKGLPGGHTNTGFATTKHLSALSVSQEHYEKPEGCSLLP